MTWTTLPRVLSAATTHAMCSALPTVLGSPSPSVPIQPPVGLNLFISLSLCRFQHSKVYPRQVDIAWMITAHHPTRLIRGSLCVPEPSPKMYVQPSVNTPLPK